VCHVSPILSADFVRQLNHTHKSRLTLSFVWHPLKLLNSDTSLLPRQTQRQTYRQTNRETERKTNRHKQTYRVGQEPTSQWIHNTSEFPETDWGGDPLPLTGNEREKETDAVRPIQSSSWSSRWQGSRPSC